MVEDLVVDTNIFVHATNPGVNLFSESLRFINRLKESGAHICVDPGFSLDESRNKSKIGHEYLRNIHFGSASYAILFELATSQRISVTSRQIENRERRIINQNVTDKTDVVFVQVTFNSVSKVLVSHDFVHLRESIRRNLHRQIGIDIQIAATCINLL